ncbi:5438_t:CDS:1, partial [Paraglomus occultum]
TKPKLKTKTYSSIIDQVEPYDVSNNILNIKSFITIAQWLQVPAQCRNFAKIMQKKKEPITEANQAKIHQSKKTIAMRCYIRIKENSVIAILDSGAAVSIITAKLIRKLELHIQRPSKTIVFTANRNHTKALGIIPDIKIKIQDIIIPINLQVIESMDETLLLEMD